MIKTDASPGPLAQEWELLAATLRKSKRNEHEMTAFQVAFYLGAQVALDAAARNPLAILHVASELRAFDKKLKEDDEVYPCPAVSIS